MASTEFTENWAKFSQKRAIALGFSVLAFTGAANITYAQDNTLQSQSNVTAIDTPDHEIYGKNIRASSRYSKKCLDMKKDCIGIMLLIGQDRLSLVKKAKEMVVDRIAKKQNINPSEVEFSDLNEITKKKISQIAYAAAIPEIYRILIKSFKEDGIETRIFAGETNGHKATGVVFLIGGVPYEDASGRSGFSVVSHALEQVNSVKKSLNIMKRLDY